MAEADIEEDVDVEDPRTLHAATDITSATHPILDRQGSKPFPVNILLDTGSLGPDRNFIHKDIVDMTDIQKGQQILFVVD